MIDMAERTCSVEECERPHLARGWCSMHWQRWRRRKTTDDPLPYIDPGCLVDGCDDPHRGHGLCNRHLFRLQHHGDPLGGGEFRFRPTSRHCSVPWCERRHYARGLCQRHWRRIKAGTTLEPPTPMERFMSCVRRDGPLPDFDPSLGPCWIWDGPEDAGYGKFSVDGRPIGAHRWSYEQFVGPIPDGLHVDHLCRVRRCVRPEHLEAVTPEENQRRGLRGVLLTHCKRGHEFTPENTRLSRGRRVCRACARLRAAAQSEAEAARL